jgi:hypothetical protein
MFFGGVMARKKIPNDNGSQPKNGEQVTSDYIGVNGAAEMVQCTSQHIRRLLTEKKLTRFKFCARTLVSKTELLGLVRRA